MTPRSELSPKKLEEAAKRLKAMAHPLRIAIIELLQKNKRLTVTQIYERLHLEQAITSHHLGILKDKGVLVAFREGKNIYYELKHEQISNIIDCLNRCGSNF
ncbi:MAG: metalloregulator ArsR/SmtB family transcription factor [Bacteroidota bacterium]